MNTRVLTAPMADKMTELGGGVVRLAFGWDVIEPDCKGCFDWTTTDAWRDEAQRTHRTIFASLAYTPAWANGGHPYRYPPLNYQDWYDFVFATVSRYRDDILLWGVWNEPNLDEYLQGSRPEGLPLARHHGARGDSRRESDWRPCSDRTSAGTA